MHGSLELCPRGTASYTVTDIILGGRYGVADGQLTLLLAETGGETSARVGFVLAEGSDGEDVGERLHRVSDGAVFARVPGLTAADVGCR